MEQSLRDSAGEVSRPIKAGGNRCEHSIQTVQQVEEVEGTMQPTMKIVVSMFLLSSVVANAYQRKTNEHTIYVTHGYLPQQDSSVKLRRDGIVNLYPFPRVGRSILKTLQSSGYGLNPVPHPRDLIRIGRRDLSMLRPKPIHPDQNIPTGVQRMGDSSGMWFGPRLGRSFKSEDDDFEPMVKRQLYAFPRVGRRDLSLLRPEPMPSEQNMLREVQRTGDSPGMWFGPRLGRAYKDEDDEITIQSENNDHSDPELMEQVQEGREKRQTKST